MVTTDLTNFPTPDILLMSVHPTELNRDEENRSLCICNVNLKAGLTLSPMSRKINNG
jgi:hypothetical protein